jgi:ubiquinone/menaquinone biosynthesis C-methylase UbiE
VQASIYIHEVKHYRANDNLLFLTFWKSRRKHHCRKCGRVVCGDHSSKKELLRDIDPREKVRVCDSCFGSGSAPPPRVLDVLATSNIVPKDFTPVNGSTGTPSVPSGRSPGPLPVSSAPVAPFSLNDSILKPSKFPSIQLPSAVSRVEDGNLTEYAESLSAIAAKMKLNGLSSEDVGVCLSASFGSSFVLSSSVAQQVTATPSSVSKSDSRPASASLPETGAALGNDRYAKYFQLQKMNVPNGAIWQKMVSEGFSDTEIDNFFAGKVAAPSTPACADANVTAPSVDDRYEKFHKMQKMHLPDGAIRQKMTAEGFAEAEIDGFFSGKLVVSVSSISSPVVNGSTTPSVEPPSVNNDRYEKFFKMQKMHLPDGAIRQKMTGEGFTEAEIEGFFSGNLVTSAPAPLAEAAGANNERYEKFFKMQKMHLPDGAIRQKMTGEGFTDAEIEGFFSGNLVTSAPAPLAPSAPLAEAAGASNERYEKFFKMQKMHLPDGAIRQKMTGEGFTDAEIEGFFSGNLVTSAPAPLAPSAPLAEAAGASNERYEKFFKMQKMHLPEGAIRQKMTGEGFTDAEIQGFFSGNLLPTPTGGSAGTPSPDKIDTSRYEKFKPALKQLKDQMLADGMTTTETDSFLAAGIAATAAPAVSKSGSVVDAGRYEKFSKMQKMHLPDGAIRQKMTSEGFSDAEIEGFFAGNLIAGPSSASESSVPAPSGTTDSAKYDKFSKMQKMHLPDGAIRQKMTQEGLSESDIENFFNGAFTAPSSGDSAVVDSAPIPGTNERYEKFCKMQKMHLPDGAIRQKMATEGFTDAEIEGFFSGNLVGSSPAGSINAADERFAKYAPTKLKLVTDMKASGLSDAEIIGFMTGQLVSPSAAAAVAGAGAALAGIKIGGGAKLASAPKAPPEPDPFPPKTPFKPVRKMRAVFLSKITKDDLLKSLWFSVEERRLDWDKIEVVFGEDKSAAANKAKSGAGDDKGTLITMVSHGRIPISNASFQARLPRMNPKHCRCLMANVVRTCP